MRFDHTGKVSLDHIYTQPDPRDYFNTLGELDYRIPQQAKPYFVKLIDDYRTSQLIPVPTVLDIGCSYGVNAVLVKLDTTMDELYQRYGAPDAHTQTRDALLVRDRELVRSRAHLTHTRFIGLDRSHPALAYALAAGFLDVAIHADFERDDPDEQQRAELAQADLVTSTGCLGYVTHRTIARIATANGGRKPWMAHFVLRMYSFDQVEESLAGLGYETIQLERVFQQRRFASADEQSLVLDTLSGIGVDPRGLETDGWLYAQLYVSRPHPTTARFFVDLAAKREPSIH